MSLMQKQPTDRSTNQAETRRKASSALARVFGVWRTGLPRPVLVLQGGNALNYFGTGLILPFEIIYLHAVRGFSSVGTAGQVLALTLVAAEQRAASTALRRVAGNFGLGLGATVAGFIVAATHHHLQAFQGLYLFDAVTFVLFALVVLVWIPDPGLADAPSASEGAQGFRAVAR